MLSGRFRVHHRNAPQIPVEPYPYAEMSDYVLQHIGADPGMTPTILRGELRPDRPGLLVGRQITAKKRRKNQPRRRGDISDRVDRAYFKEQRLHEACQRKRPFSPIASVAPYTVPPFEYPAGYPHAKSGIAVIAPCPTWTRVKPANRKSSNTRRT